MSLGSLELQLKSSSPLLSILSDRALMMRSVREFFFERHVLEVDTPLLSSRACVDAHIDLMLTEVCKGSAAYLHSSPEYAMKKLLSKQIPDIYQLSHVFRMGEIGSKHLPEFMMIEWYRRNISLEQLLKETLDLITLFLGQQETRLYSYEELFEIYLGVNPLQTSPSIILQLASDLGCNKSPSLEAALYFLWDHIESKLDKDVIIIVNDFPAAQASLSKIYEKNHKLYAKRFEIYLNGLELANGFDELLDPIEQKNRLEQENLKRISLGKPFLPLDEDFIAALAHGLGDCCGVAVGFDRLMMLRHKTPYIQDVVPLPYSI